MDDFQTQEQQNKQKFMEVLRLARPEIFMIAKLIDDNKINPNIVFHYLNGLIDVATSTTYGSVVTEIESNVVRFIRAQANRKINEALLIPDDTVNY